ncbi:hypothetical protein HHI36_012369 [Cryptolaemus montrouzieri]|uniref:RNase H type-1 domain-containing protein n=1 Tax=Cryptolaemus montrouzieri TaxID=559131 RepID=A0ABD2NET3_9CUCU
MELCLRCGIKISTDFTNPAHKATFIENFHDLNKTSITLALTNENIHHLAKVNLHLETLGSKTNTKPSDHQGLHDRICENHPNHSYSYKVGSKPIDGAGCSIVLDTIEPQVLCFKLPNDASIFTCEAFAILKTLEIASEVERLIIFSDLKSVLTAICNQHSTNKLIKKFRTSCTNTNQPSKLCKHGSLAHGYSR